MHCAPAVPLLPATTEKEWTLSLWIIRKAESGKVAADWRGSEHAALTAHFEPCCSEGCYERDNCSHMTALWRLDLGLQVLFWPDSLWIRQSSIICAPPRQRGSWLSRSFETMGYWIVSGFKEAIPFSKQWTLKNSAVLLRKHSSCPQTCFVNFWLLDILPSSLKILPCFQL